MRILVPTDFSKNASHAIDYAVTLARATNAEIVLLHVYTPPATNNISEHPRIMEEINAGKVFAQEQLSKEHEKISESRVQVRSVMTLGGVVEEIKKESETCQADLIIMGTRGATGLDKLLFGSNTADVIEHVSCPLLAIPEGAPNTVAKKIAFATNYLDSDMETLKSLMPVVELLGAELYILHIAKDKLKSERDLIEEFSKTVAQETGYPQPYYYVMQHDDIQKGIDLFVASSGCDLIALSTRKRTLFEKIFQPSLTKRMAYQTKLPLLAFHAKPIAQDPEYGDF